MRIAIISYPRTGGTTLLHSIADILDLDYLSEPFRYQDVSYKILDIPNVLKTQVYDTPIDMDNKWFHKHISDNYDFVILLGRKDSEEQAISNHIAIQSNNWDSEYEVTSTIMKTFQKENAIKFAENCKSQLLEVSNKIYKKDILWYESLYSSDIDIRKNSIKTHLPFFNDNQIDKIVKDTNPKKRYRKYKKTY